MIAALYVETDGVYFGREDVDPWDVHRDAKLYDGPHAVVAHPPCGPWDSLKHLSRKQDPSCGPRAVEQVRRWGGVLEHPARSSLFDAMSMSKPGDLPDAFGGVSIEVCQVDWGHVARKRTWLYLIGVRAVGPRPVPRQPTHWCSGFRSSTRNTPSRYRSRGSAVPPGIKVCSAQQRRRTPPAFAEYLIALARSARTEAA